MSLCTSNNSREGTATAVNAADNVELNAALEQESTSSADEEAGTSAKQAAPDQSATNVAEPVRLNRVAQDALRQLRHW